MSSVNCKAVGPGMRPRRSVLPLVPAIALFACASSSSLEPAPAYAPTASAMRPVSCHTELASDRVDGRPQVVTRCRTFALSMASYRARVIYLRDLVRAGRDPGAVGDHEIQETEEYESYMDSRNRWQWQLHVTRDEALAACRAMLLDLASGAPVDWDTQAREYLTRVRSTPASGASPTPTVRPRDSSRVTSSQADGTPADPRGPGDAPTAIDGPTVTPGTPSPGPDPLIIAPSGPRVAVPIDYRRRFEDDWRLLEGLRAEGRHIAADRLEHLLETAGTQLAAVTILLSGTAILITGVATPSGILELSIIADGVVPADLALATRTSAPALEQLAETVRQLEQLKETLALPEPLDPPGLDLSSGPRIEYRTLRFDALERLDQPALERLQALADLAGDQPTDLEPGTPLHKAQRWREYTTRDGTWPFERWSTTYDQNMTRATRAHAFADAYRDKLGWGQREYTVKFGDLKRVLDIADTDGLRGVEVKSGYVSLTADVAYELKRDAILVDEENWIIEWFVDGRMSAPLRKALRAANIQFTETKPTTPIQDL